MAALLLCSSYTDFPFLDLLRLAVKTFLPCSVSKLISSLLAFLRLGLSLCFSSSSLRSLPEVEGGMGGGGFGLCGGTTVLDDDAFDAFSSLGTSICTSFGP